jgi:GH15 family glucan-1,4-alpha-glucosidase
VPGLLGRVDEATEGFERLLQLSGPTGLLSEEVRADRTMVGNLPQAFSHVGLVNAAGRLTEATGESDRGTPDGEAQTSAAAGDEAS